MSSSSGAGNAFLIWWNPQSLAVKFSLGFGALIVLVILAAITKLIYDKVTLKGHIRREKAELAARKEREAHEERVIKRLSSMEEGELFGVRAIQSGFFGGVTQSAPSSPAGSRAGSRAGSLYNQPVSPSGPLNGSSPYLPLMHPQSASPLASTASLPLVRSPLGLTPNDRRSFSSGPTSPLPSAQSSSNTPRPGTSGSNRGFATGSPLIHQRQQSEKTINLDGLAPTNLQPSNASLRPSASDASDATKPSSTNNGTSHGSHSRGSSFTSTYSFDEGSERQTQKGPMVAPIENLPTIPVLTPLTAEVHNADPRRPLPQNSNFAAELPVSIKRSTPPDTNFSTPFRRRSQPESVILQRNTGFGPLPAAAMNGGPQQFGSPFRTQSPAPPIGRPPPQQYTPQRTQSPAPMNDVPARTTNSPGPFPLRGPLPPRQGSMPDTYRPHRDPPNHRRAAAPTPLDFESRQPSIPSFLQQDNGPRTAPLNPTTSRTLMPIEQPKQNRLTADLLSDFYESYQYDRNSKEEAAFNHRRGRASQPGQGFEMASMSAQRQAGDRRLV